MTRMSHSPLPTGLPGVQDDPVSSLFETLNFSQLDSENIPWKILESKNSYVSE